MLEAAAGFAAGFPGHLRRPPLDRLPAPGDPRDEVRAPGFRVA